MPSNDSAPTVHVIGYDHARTLCGLPISTDMLLRHRYAQRPLGPTGCQDCLRIVRDEDERSGDV